MIRLSDDSQIITLDECVRVFRFGSVQYVNGKPVQQEEQSFEVACTVQPLMGRELLIVPEGDRFREQYYLWTECTDIRISDRVDRLGVHYEVQQAEYWGSYVRARIVRIDTGKERN